MLQMFCVFISIYWWNFEDWCIVNCLPMDKLSYLNCSAQLDRLFKFSSSVNNKKNLCCARPFVHQPVAQTSLFSTAYLYPWLAVLNTWCPKNHRGTPNKKLLAQIGLCFKNCLNCANCLHYRE